MFFDKLEAFDKEVYDACTDELQRQRDNIELIASENIVSEAVLLAAGSVLTNKYAEGYPGKRYYGGCAYVDVVEEIARERAKKLFGAALPMCSRTAAPTRIWRPVCPVQPGDTVMGMNLAHGGHPFTRFAGQHFRQIF